MKFHSATQDLLWLFFSISWTIETCLHHQNSRQLLKTTQGNKFIRNLRVLYMAKRTIAPDRLLLRNFFKHLFDCNEWMRTPNLDCHIMFFFWFLFIYLLNGLNLFFFMLNNSSSLNFWAQCFIKDKKFLGNKGSRTL